MSIGRRCCMERRVYSVVAEPVNGLSARLSHFRLAPVVFAVALAGAPMAHAANNSRPPYGLSARIAPEAYLGLPHLAGGNVPPLLSQTGAFSDTRNLIPTPGPIAYHIVVAFWSDGAAKSPWVPVPNRKIKHSPPRAWTFPTG